MAQARVRLMTGGPDAAAWLRLAVARAAELDESRLVLSAALPPRRGKPDPRQRWIGGLHRHVYPELALSLRGPAVLDVGESRHDFGDGRAAVLEPNVMHCEGYRRQGDDYAILWIVGVLPLGVALFSRYRAGAGWDCPLRLTFRTRRTVRLFEPFTAAEVRMSPQRLDPLRAELLGLLTELHDAVHRQQRDPAVPGTPARQHAELLAELRRWLDDHLDEPVSVADLAGMTRLSPNHLNTLFAQAHGEAIHTYLLRQRMTRALRLLRETDMLVKEVARRVGFADPLYFSRAFSKYHGRSARSVRESSGPAGAT